MSFNGITNNSILNNIKVNTSFTTRNLGTRTTNPKKSTNSDIIPGGVSAGFSETINNSLNKITSILAPGMPVNSIEITHPLSAVTMVLSSTSINDTAAGTGAQFIQINGLDTNFIQISEIVTMTGTSGTTATTNLFLRINDLIVVASGSNEINVGSIYVSPSTDTIGGTTAGVPDTLIYNLIKPETNISTTGVFTVPAGFDYLPTEIQFSTDAVATNPVDIRFWFKLNNLGLPKFEASEVQLTTGLTEFNVDGFTFPEKMDYFVTAVGQQAQSSKVKHIVNGVLRKM